MINKIGKITVYVQDQDQAKDFWINKAGFVLKEEQPMGPDFFLDRSGSK
jgi:lactoylglutathione lyase